MKTLLFTLEYPPFFGGVANYYGNLAKYWPVNEKLLVLDNNRGELIKGRRFLSWLPAVPTLARKLRMSQIDYLLVGQVLPLGTVAWLVSLMRPIKYAVFFHGMDLALALRTGRKRLITKLILKRAHQIICANSYVRDRLLEFMDGIAAKIVIVNPGIESGVPTVDEKDLNALRMSHNLEGKKILFTLGRLVKRKGVDRTIASLIALPEEITKDLVYVIAGTGPREEYLKSLVPLRFARKIIFLGAVTETEKWAWFKLCDIFVMPSRDISGDFEGFGIVYLEAGLFAKPVIAGNSGGVKDAVSHEETGLLVDPENIENLQLAIMRLLTDPELRQRLGENGQRRALKDFNWEKQSQKILAAIKR